jgi:hypothetical protein
MLAKSPVVVENSSASAVTDHATREFVAWDCSEPRPRPSTFGTVISIARRLHHALLMESGSYAACSSRLHNISTRVSAVAPHGGKHRRFLPCVPYTEAVGAARRRMITTRSKGFMVLTLAAVALAVHDSDVAQASPVTSIRTT